MMFGLKVWATALFVFLVSWSGAASAQAVATLNDNPLVVRLCPENCRPVRNHGLKNGDQVTLYENTNGWVRVSEFYKRSQLWARFGLNLPRKPALWVPITNLAVPTAEEVAENPAVLLVDAVTKIANLREIPVPKFRTGATQTANAEPEQNAAAEREKMAQLEAEKIKAEEERAARAAAEAEAKAEAKAKAEAAAQEKERQEKARQEEIAATERAERERLAAQKAAAEKAEVEAKEKAEAEARAAAEKAEAERLKADEAVEEAAPASQNAETEVALAEPELEVAAPPSSETPAETSTEAPAEPPAETAGETITFESANAAPLALDARPSSLTDELMDERLAVLPSKVTRRDTKEIVIALRHYAKALLDSETCTGIAEGGRSAQPGMLFIKCTDDPYYLRVFPLQEVSW